MNTRIDANRDGTLFLSIPYEDKFKVYVDGKKVKYYSLFDNVFMGIDITRGKHDIKIIYEDKRLYLYFLLTFISIIITFVVYYFYNYKLIKNK